MHTNEHENNMELEAKWFELEQARKDLLSGQAIKEIGPEVFHGEKECACCMDERVGNRETLGGEEMGRRWNVAGSGILLPEASWKERVKLAAKEAFDRGVTVLTFHDGCGAAGLAVKQDLEQFTDEEKAKYQANSDLYGQRFVELAQEELNRLNKKEQKSLHVTKEEVQPFEFHAAIGATVDATGEFNAYQLPGENPFKYTFNIDTSSGRSVQGEKANYYMNELVVAIRIATGHHGFGHKFNADNPFAIVLVAETKEEIEEREKEIRKFVEENEPKAKNIIKFVEFIKPEGKHHKKAPGKAAEETQVQL
jgi:hypothetical protein